MPTNESPYDYQIGGNHYQSMKMQPIELFNATNLPFPEASAVKYLSRWKQKGGLEDLEKAKQCLRFAIDREDKKVELFNQFTDQLDMEEANIIHLIGVGYFHGAIDLIDDLICLLTESQKSVKGIRIYASDEEVKSHE